MTGPTSESRPDGAHPPDGGDSSQFEPEVTSMPAWLPLLVGGILLAIAALAVYTGLSYRDQTLTAHVGSVRKAKPASPAPPGEPGAGASLVMHGESGENTPAANEAVPGSSRTLITGGPGGVQAISRIHARRGMVLHIEPRDALVYVNALPVGEAQQFDSVNEAYEFPEAGSYTVRVVAPNGAERTFLVTTAEDAYADVANIEAKLTHKQ